jgi:site-specific DNA-methyltransferase (adenine-specific)
MEENVNGCYAQKPLKSATRIISASSKLDDLVVDFFSHAGTTLIASEQNRRRCFTMDIDPIFCEITIRRLERFRETRKTGWQNSHPFIDEQQRDPQLAELLRETMASPKTAREA